MTRKDRLLEEWLRATANLDKARERHRPTRQLTREIQRIRGELSVMLREEQAAPKVGI